MTVGSERQRDSVLNETNICRTLILVEDGKIPMLEQM